MPDADAAPAPTPETLARRVRFVALGETAHAIHFLGDAAVFIGSEEAALSVGDDDTPRRIVLHGGAILSSACDGSRIVTGGDDGRVVALAADGGITDIATDAKRRWIDAVALHKDGAVAWSAGKTAFVRAAKGEEKSLDVPSSVGGLAFLPKGFRLAIAHYNGVTLWFPNMAGAPDLLEWKGSHLAVAVSPDNRFLVTAMQEQALHGWRLTDAKNMRMTGYPTRVKSMGFLADGRWLATAGADELICWPFQTKDGPMGKQPGALAPPNPSCVQVVACHPAEPAVVAGYGDGMVRLIRVPDGAVLPLAQEGRGAVTAAAWNSEGTRLAFAFADGTAGLLRL